MAFVRGTIRLMSIEWGTVGEWAGAAGTVFVGAVAIWVSRRDGRRAQEIADLTDAGRVHISVAANSQGVHGAIVNGSVTSIYHVEYQGGPEWDESRGVTRLARISAGQNETYHVSWDRTTLPAVLVRFSTETGIRWEAYPDRAPRRLRSKPSTHCRKRDPRG